MLLHNIKGVIGIIESKEFNNTFYKQFILEELSQPTKMSGMMKGGLAVGGGLLAAAALNSNPELKQQLSNTVKSLGTSVSNAAHSVTSKIHSVSKEAAQVAKDKADEYKVTHPVLNDSVNEKDLNDNIIKAESGANNPTLSPLQQKQYAQSHRDMLAFQREQEHSGFFKSGYSKTHNPHVFDSIRSNSEKVAVTKQFDGDISAAKQTVQQKIDSVKDFGNKVKIGASQASDTVKTLWNQKQ
jgi:uncharacterized protein YoxC